MYRRYYNEYEKRADEIRRAAQLVEKGGTKPPSIPTNQTVISKPENKGLASFLPGFKADDILLGVLIFFLMLEENPDKTLILALAFIFLSGF